MNKLVNGVNKLECFLLVVLPACLILVDCPALSVDIAGSSDPLYMWRNFVIGTPTDREMD